MVSGPACGGRIDVPAGLAVDRHVERVAELLWLGLVLGCSRPIFHGTFGRSPQIRIFSICMMKSTEVIELVKIVGGVVAFSLGLWQYRVAQSWKRMEFIAAEIAKFRADPMVKKVFLMLDWRARRIDLGVAKAPDEAIPVVTYELVTCALVLHSEDKTFTPIEAAIRDHFDVFLDYLCHFEAFISAGLVRSQELRPYLEYWTNAVAGGDNIPRELLVQFWQFVDSYGYASARRLVSRLHPSLSSDFPEAAGDS